MSYISENLIIDIACHTSTLKALIRHKNRRTYLCDLSVYIFILQAICRKFIFPLQAHSSTPNRRAIYVQKPRYFEISKPCHIGT